MNSIKANLNGDGNVKILFFLGFPNPFPGAAWTRIGFFAHYFKSKGHKIDVAGVFSPRSLDKAGSTCWNGVNIYNICPTFWIENIFSFFFNILFSFIVFPLFLLSLRPDLIIISVPSGEPAVGVYFASRLAKSKVVFDYRDEWEDYAINKSRSKIYRGAYKFLKTLMIKIYLKSELVVTVTHPYAKSLSLKGVRNVKVVPNGADTNIFKPYDKKVMRQKFGLPMDDLIIVYSGGIGGYYKLDVVVRALAKFDSVSRDKMKLLLVGNGPDLQKIIDMAKNLGLESNIVYLGIKNDKKELAEIISAADAGIIPYDDNLLWKNSLPAKFFEYSACGLPVIATAYEDSLLVTLIKKYGIGMASPPLDEEELVEVIDQLYKNRSFREAAGKKARIFIEKKFDRNKIAEEFLNLLKYC